MELDEEAFQNICGEHGIAEDKVLRTNIRKAWEASSKAVAESIDSRPGREAQGEDETFRLVAGELLLRQFLQQERGRLVSKDSQGAGQGGVRAKLADTSRRGDQPRQHCPGPAAETFGNERHCLDRLFLSPIKEGGELASHVPRPLPRERLDCRASNRLLRIL